MLTLHQLELMAAVIGVKLAETILTALQALVKGSEVIIWSDSQIIIHWFSNIDMIKCQFVSNRVATIRDLTIEKSGLALLYNGLQSCWLTFKRHHITTIQQINNLEHGSNIDQQ